LRRHLAPLPAIAWQAHHADIAYSMLSALTQGHDVIQTLVWPSHDLATIRASLGTIEQALNYSPSERAIAGLAHQRVTLLLGLLQSLVFFGSEVSIEPVANTP
jgi:hypothetical protein